MPHTFYILEQKLVFIYIRKVKCLPFASTVVVVGSFDVLVLLPHEVDLFTLIICVFCWPWHVILKDTVIKIEAIFNFMLLFSCVQSATF